MGQRLPPVSQARQRRPSYTGYHVGKARPVHHGSRCSLSDRYGCVGDGGAEPDAGPGVGEVVGDVVGDVVGES
jgi:hypothetical protein